MAEGEGTQHGASGHHLVDHPAVEGVVGGAFRRAVGVGLGHHVTVGVVGVTGQARGAFGRELFRQGVEPPELVVTVKSDWSAAPKTGTTGVLTRVTRPRRSKSVVVANPRASVLVTGLPAWSKVVRVISSPVAGEAVGSEQWLGGRQPGPNSV